MIQRIRYDAPPDDPRCQDEVPGRAGAIGSDSARRCERPSSYQFGSVSYCHQHAKMRWPDCARCREPLRYPSIDAAAIDGVPWCSPCRAQVPGIGQVYFMASAGLIKIGHSRQYRSRLTALRTMSAAPVDLVGLIVGTQDDERALHARFAHLRQHGEWFKDCDELRAYIDEHATPPDKEAA